MEIGAFGAWLAPRLQALGGGSGVLVKNLVTGESWSRGADTPVNAASVIKIPVMIEAFRAAQAGELSLQETHRLQDAERLPSCGTLRMMHAGVEVTLMDLVHLMITVSDNTATNILIRRLGMERINATLRALGCERTVLRRLLFDGEAAARGLTNHITARETGMLLEGLWRGEIVSPEASAAMMEILLDQRLNGKLPFYLHPAGVRIAHKTGEDSGVTHDVGVVMTREPMVVCFVGERMDVPAYERLMQDAMRVLCLEN